MSDEKDPWEAYPTPIDEQDTAENGPFDHLDGVPRPMKEEPTTKQTDAIDAAAALDTKAALVDLRTRVLGVMVEELTDDQGLHFAQKILGRVLKRLGL